MPHLASREELLIFTGGSSLFTFVEGMDNKGRVEGRLRKTLPND
jgi:hypothetical protein